MYGRAPDEEEGPVELPPAERRRLTAIGWALGAAFFGFVGWGLPWLITVAARLH